MSRGYGLLSVWIIGQWLICIYVNRNVVIVVVLIWKEKKKIFDFCLVIQNTHFTCKASFRVGMEHMVDREITKRKYDFVSSIRISPNFFLHVFCPCDVKPLTTWNGISYITR